MLAIISFYLFFILCSFLHHLLLLALTSFVGSVGLLITSPECFVDPRRNMMVCRTACTDHCSCKMRSAALESPLTASACSPRPEVTTIPASCMCHHICTALYEAVFLLQVHLVSDSIIVGATLCFSLNMFVRFRHIDM